MIGQGGLAPMKLHKRYHPLSVLSKHRAFAKLQHPTPSTSLPSSLLPLLLLAPSFPLLAMASTEGFAHGSEPHEEAAELEIPEVDGALLREILEELDKDDIATGSSCDRVEYVVQPLEVLLPGPISEAPNSEQERVLVQDLDWLEDLVLPGEEVKMGWYGDETVGTMEFHYVVEDGNWEFYDGIASEEIGYGCLWENS